MQAHTPKQPIIIIGSTILCLSLISVFQLAFPQNAILNKLDIWQVFKQNNTTTIALNSNKPIYNNDSIANKTNTDVNLIYNDYSNSNYFEKQIKKMQALKNSNNSFDIIWLGDSFIETDVIVNTMRKQLQQNYGGAGVGFLPITNNNVNSTSNYTISPKGNWLFKNALQNLNEGAYFLNGTQAITTNNSSVQLKIIDNTNYTLTNNIAINFLLQNKTNLNAISFNKTNSCDTNIVLPTNQVVYGATMQSTQGVHLHNMSVRGATGLHLQHVDSTVYELVNNHFKPQIIMVQYGTNVLANNNTTFTWYKAAYDKAIAILKNKFPDAAIVIIGLPDKASKNNGVFETDAGLPIILKWQQETAQKYNAVFINTYQAMGGHNSIVNWVNSTPTLAYKDYTHLNPTGEAALGNILYKTIFKH